MGYINNQDSSSQGYKPLQTGSSYLDLDNYFNQNASQGQDLSNQLYGKVNSDISQGQQGLDSQVGTTSASITGANDIPSSDDLTKAVSDPTNADPTQYLKWLNQSYGGPNSADLSQSATTAANNQQEAQASGNEAGRSAILQTYFKQPGQNYGLNESMADQFLVQKAQGSGDQYKQAMGSANQVGQNVSQVQNQLQGQIASQIQNVEGSNQAARAAIGIDGSGNAITDPTAAGYGAIGKERTTIDGKLTTANDPNGTGYGSQYGTFLSGIQNGTLTPDQYAALGIAGPSTIQGGMIRPNTQNSSNNWGVDLSTYLSKNPDLNLSQVMSPEDLAQIKALDAMSGVADTQYNNPLTAAGQGYTFNTPGAKAAISQAESTFDTERNKLLTHLEPGGQSGADLSTQAQIQALIDDENGKGQTKNPYDGTWKVPTNVKGSGVTMVNNPPPGGNPTPMAPGSRTVVSGSADPALAQLEALYKQYGIS